MFIYSSYHTLLSVCMQILNKVLIMETKDSYYLDICVAAFCDFLALYVLLFFQNFYGMGTNTSTLNYRLESHSVSFPLTLVGYDIASTSMPFLRRVV